MDKYYCKHEDCTTYATYGYDQGENIFCGLHKSEDMIITPWVGLRPSERITFFIILKM